MSWVKGGPATYRVMPWKNGGGATTELLVDPPEASLASGFRWRVSMAGLAASGPFSSFKGYDRTLVLLEGDGLRVDHGSEGSVLLSKPMQACAFPGEWATEGVLLGGPCRDFNVMSDRRQVRHEVYVLRPGLGITPLPEGPVVLVYCARGKVAFPALGEALDVHELLRIDEGGPLGMTAPEPDTAVIVAVFHPL